MTDIPPSLDPPPRPVPISIVPSTLDPDISISTALVPSTLSRASDIDSIISGSTPATVLADTDLYRLTPHSSFPDDQFASLFYMDAVFPDDTPHTDTSPWTGSPGTYGTLHTPPALKYHDDAVPPPDTTLEQLLDVQIRLSHLVRGLFCGIHGPGDVEEIYRTSEILIRILDRGQTASDPTYAPPFGKSAQPKPPGVILHLIITNYFNLIHAYEALVDMLKNESVQEQQQPQQAHSHSHSHSHHRAGHHVDPSETPSPPASVPKISIGGFQLAMPQKAYAEINLHLAAQTVQQLRTSMKLYSRRIMGKVVDGDIMDLAATALSGLKIREDDLVAPLRGPGSE